MRKAARGELMLWTSRIRRAAGRPAAAVLAGLLPLASLAPATASTLTWTITPNPTIKVSAQLNSVSCPSASFCVAAGLAAPPGKNSVAHPLIESWHGKTWSVVRTPSEPTAELWGVSCPSDRFCVAVGFSGNAVETASLIERWNGRRWAVAQPAMLGDELTGVSCASATACAAVGTNGSHNLAEMWNGSKWSVVPTPNRGRSFGDLLSGVSCPSAAHCTAVGEYGVSPHGLIESWNGTKWSVVASPKQSETFLDEVSCVSARSCSAVGSSGFNDTLDAETWNGTRWSSAPVRGSRNAGFNDVACVSAANCTAAGWYQPRNPDAAIQSLIWSWNGKTWSRVPTPSPAKRKDNQLMGVGCASARACAAVGFIAPNSTRNTSDLTEIGR